MRAAVLLTIVLVLLWVAGVAGDVASQRECEALGMEWVCECRMPPSPPPPPPPLRPSTWGEILAVSLFYGMVVSMVGGLGWVLRFA